MLALYDTVGAGFRLLFDLRVQNSLLILFRFLNSTLLTTDQLVYFCDQSNFILYEFFRTLSFLGMHILLFHNPSCNLFGEVLSTFVIQMGHFQLQKYIMVVGWNQIFFVKVLN